MKSLNDIKLAKVDTAWVSKNRTTWVSHKLVTYLHGISPPLRTAKLTAAHTIVTRVAVVSQLLPQMLKIKVREGISGR